MRAGTVRAHNVDLVKVVNRVYIASELPLGRSPQETLCHRCTEHNSGQPRPPS